MKKKIIAAMLTLAMVATVFCGCGKEEKTEQTKPDKPDKTEQTDDSFVTPAEAEFGEAVNYGGCGITELNESVAYNITDYVTLCDYDGAKIDVDLTKGVSENELNDYIDSVLSTYLEFNKTDKDVVENLDYVNIDYVGKKDGVAFEGGTAEDFNLGIGTHTFIDGFEEGLIGAHVGDVIDLELTFPEVYHSEELAGQPVVFTVTVNYICKKNTRTHETADDEFISSRTIYSTYDEFKAAAKEYYEKNRQLDEMSLKDAAAMEYIIENSEIKIPDGLIDAKVEQKITQFKHQVVNYGYDVETYLSTAYNMTYKEFEEYVRENTEDAVKEELVLEAIANDLDLKIEDADFYNYLNESVESNGLTEYSDLYESFASENASGALYLARAYLLTQAKNQYKSNIVYNVIGE